jgi:hypothetical protein
VITVNNADEEAAATAKDEPADERATLLEQARGLGLSPHPLTGVAKLREAIAAAQA